MNRCNNSGLKPQTVYLSSEETHSLRKQIDIFIEIKLDEWHAAVPLAQYFNHSAIDATYHVRHLIESIWRIRLLRIAGAKTFTSIAKISPAAAKIWGNYELAEMSRDELFLQDLQHQGITRESVHNIEPYLSTKLLTGFFYYLLEHESPLGILTYSYLVEHVNIKSEPKHAENHSEMTRPIKLANQITANYTNPHAHHTDELWKAICHLIQHEQDIENIFRYLNECQEILAMYFAEICADILNKQEAA